MMTPAERDAYLDEVIYPPKGPLEVLYYNRDGTPSIRYLVTKVGTGIAGHTAEQVAPFFVGAPANVVLPREFEAAL